MIQFKRGKAESWASNKKPLADGQPGYDKDRKKIKIGNGKDSWDALPYASGMSAEEILSSEDAAKKRVAKVPGLGLIGNAFNKILTALKLDDRPIFTYGPELPDENTVGRVYLQYYDAEPEVDYIVEVGASDIWTYRKWHSGFAECRGTLELSTTVQESAGALYSDNKAMQDVKYPFAFKGSPTELASLQSSGGIVWLAGRASNTESHTGLYSLISVDKHANLATYKITLNAAGFYK